MLFEWAEREEDIKKKLEVIFEMDRKTHQVVTNVRETQIDDSKAIQAIRHTQRNTQEGVAELLDRQHKFQETFQETKSRVEETHGILLRAQGEHFEAMRQDLKQTAEDLEGKREKHRENEILKKLAKIDTLKDVRYHAEKYIEGTRSSIFAKVESWLNDRSSPNRVMVISGNAGMGKSVISAVMCEKMQEAGRLAGSHFCQHDRARHRNPKVMLQSLASQLCDFVPDYKKGLAEKLSRNLGVEINNMEVNDLFEVLFEEPLTSLNDPGLTYLMVIDGLDESEFQGRNELLDVIANYFQGLPLWIRFLVTTRPEINIAENLENLHPLQLDPNAEENVKDIYLCFEKEISHLLQSEHRGNILQALVEKSEGVMLYAHYLVDFIKKEVPVLSPELLDSVLPSGISTVYHSYFKRLENELCKELNVTEEQFLNFLSTVAAAREPLPLGFVPILLLPGKPTSVVQRKLKAAIGCVSTLLPVQDECIHFFHKSVKDWLIEKSNYEQHYFSVDEKEGHEVLSKLCIDELSQVKRKGVDCAKFSDITKYALRHGVQHMLQLEDARVCSLEEVVKKFVLDVELVYAKLCVNVTAASEDIVGVQKIVGIRELQRALNTLLVLLRKHIATLEKLPHHIFQNLLNEGGPEFSSEASHLLETKYSEIAYMEYLQKEDLQGRVQTKFQCSSSVICFDVSPQLDYMVCECRDNTIQLWSLHTGKQLWKRNFMVPKDNYCLRYEDYDYRPIYEMHKATKTHCVKYDETGFLLGDPFCLPSEGDTIHSWKPSHAFVLNEKSVLTVASGARTIQMLQLDEVTKDSAGVSMTTARKVVLSLSGGTLYVITTVDGSPATLVAWDITSGMSKPGKKVIEHTGGFNKYNLVAVREGVLLQTSHKALELWNVELSECIRSWTDLEYITEVIPISEERVACEGESKVVIVDTTREGNVSRITFHGNFVGCNSKCHVISAAHGKLQMKCGDKVLWKISQPCLYFGFS